MLARFQKSFIRGLICTLISPVSLIRATAVILLLATPFSQAQTVLFDPDDATKAIGIQNLSYNNELWNVGFTDFVSARSVYGDHPGIYDFPGIDLAEGAIVAVNTALNASVATGVGSDTLVAADTYAIGYFPQGGNTVPEAVLIATGSNNTMAPMNWGVGTLEGSVLYNVAENAAPTWADFTLVSAVQTVIFDESGTNAIGIENLDIGGELFDVSFTASVTAAQAYGPFPGEYDVAGVNGAISAVDAMTEALNDAGADTVGEGASSESFFVGYLSTDPLGLESVTHREAVISGAWDQNPISFTTPYNTGDKVWADFSGDEPDPVSIGGTVTGLVGSGLVLQNNGGDNLTVAAADIVFEFAEPVIVGDPYEVTVLTQPDGQTCSVENFSGVAPDVDVTDVEVTCGELVEGDVIAVATEGDILGGTPLTEILLEGGVGINRSGKVAFGGKDDLSNIAVFTQDGLVVKEGDILEDDTELMDISAFGEVAISAGQFGDRVAFHGTDGDFTDAVFTQDGPVAKVRGTLPDDTFVEKINSQGKVAINNLDQVAFHGKVLSSHGRVNAVFTSDAIVAQEEVSLEDRITPQSINATGGVAINDFGEVAFHGKILRPGHPSGTKAVFTQHGLVAREGGTLLPGGTIVSDIDVNGGVAINLFGDVAFHGFVGPELTRAVFVKLGFNEGELVVKEGDILGDGTPLDEIEESGGVAINFFGDVAFHGRTGGVKAVFTQHGLVVKESDILDGGKTLSEIHQTGGVTINFYGDVAFHGRTGSTDAVLVGPAPLPPAVVPPASE